jgi:hypothetical protein
MQAGRPASLMETRLRFARTLPAQANAKEDPFDDRTASKSKNGAIASFVHKDGPAEEALLEEAVK